VVQRAAGARKPVIATDVGEIGDLVRRHGLGLIAEPENARELANTIKQYTRERVTIQDSIAKRASLYISQNHWRQTAASVLKAYQGSVLGTRTLPHFEHSH